MTTPLAQGMIAAEWVFPVVQSLHFVGFALSIGTIAIVDLRLLGWAMRRQTAAELAAELSPWTQIGIILMLTTGFMMFSTDAVAYHFNPSFQFKMYCLTAALIFHFTLHRLVIRPGTPAIAAKSAAIFSLVLWSSVVWGGRFVAFI
jgi:hypothetical protein